MTLLLSFLFVFMIPVLIGSLVYVQIERIMVDNAYRSNSAMLEQVKHVANGRTQEIDYLMRQIAFHPKQQLIMQKGGAFASPREQYQFIEFMEELTRYSAYNSFVEDIYVYFGQADTILTPTMKTDASTFYHHIYPYRNMSFDEYKHELLLGNHYKSYKRTELRGGASKGQSMITYVQSLPFGETGNASGSLVVLINEQEMQDLLREVEGLHNGKFYILNRDQEILIGPPDQERIDAYIGKLSGERGQFLYDSDGREHYVSYVTSSENGWTFLSVFPKQVVLEQVNTVKLWSIVTVLTCLAVGIALCVYLTRRHYLPIKNLVGMIMRGRSEVGVEAGNELMLISDTMQSLFGKEHELQQRLTSQMPIMRTSFLTRLIHGQVDLESMTDADMEMLGVRFDHDWFAVIVLDIEEGSTFMKDDTEREWMLLRFILLNVSHEMLGSGGYAYEDGKNRIIILLNLEQGTFADAESPMDALLVRLMSVMRDRFKTRMTAGVSGTHQGLERIAECYDEAMIALSYKLLEGTDAILHYEKERVVDSGAYRFPNDLEVQLTNYMKNGDWGNTERLLNSLYHMNFVQGRISPDMGRWFFLDLHSTLLKLMEASRMDGEAILPGAGEPTKWMSESATAEQMFERIAAMYERICRSVHEDRTDHSEQLYQKLVQFIANNYHDNSLGLAMLAEQMNLSPIYISAFFKKHSGENMTDYITRMRISHAKRLLAEEMTVQEIALQVGYASNIVLTKVFKKIEGITPGKYREQLRNMKHD
jgi:two-component system, response regulator YesN